MDIFCLNLDGFNKKIYFIQVSGSYMCCLDSIDMSGFLFNKSNVYDTLVLKWVVVVFLLLIDYVDLNK